MIRYILFPFDKIEKNSKVVIYGAGEIGTNFKRQIDSIQYCEIVCFIDKKAEKIVKVDNIKCDTLDNLSNYEFDYLVIASIAYKDEIYNNILLNKDIKNSLNKDKIILLNKKNDISISCHKLNTPEGDWEEYYKLAESCADTQFNRYILPLLEKHIKLDKKNSTVVDFACGHGRIADEVKNLCKKIICCDISEDAINFCKERFKDFDNIDCVVNELDRISLDNNSCDLIYSWDAMVHFSYKLLDIYTDEFYRIIKPNGYAIIHHSNLADTGIEFKSDIWCENPGCRSNVSAKDYAYIAKKHGFKVIEQKIIDWGVKDLDCITILKKD